MGAGLLEPPHLLLILALALVLFGAGKLADTGAALGKSVRDFRKAVKDEDAPAESQPTLKVVKTDDSSLPPKAS
jgi:sec-independent protein translocase protein TatA